MSRALLFVFLVLSPWLHATVEDEACEKQVLVARHERAGQFIFGRSSLTNLSLLRSFEEIDRDVASRFQQEVQSNERLTLPQSQEIAREFRAQPTESNRLKLFNATKIVVPIAARLLLKRIKSVTELEDYLQAGYLGLWKEIGQITKIREEKLSSLMFWNSLLNGLRREAFNEMRAEFRKQYSLTPVSFNTDRPDRFTFEEEILLFGDSPTARAEIAQRYRKTPALAEAEWNLQQDSISANELNGEASIEPEITPGNLHTQEIQATINSVMSTLPPRQERAIRETVMGGVSVTESAAAAHVSRQSVEFWVTRGLRNLRRPETARLLRPFANYTPPVLKPIPAKPLPTESEILLEQEKKLRADMIKDYLALRKIENTASISILKTWRMAGEFNRFEQAFQLFMERNKVESNDIIYIHSVDFEYEIKKSAGSPIELAVQLEKTRMKFESEITESVQRMRILTGQLTLLERHISEEFEIYRAQLEESTAALNTLRGRYSHASRITVRGEVWDRRRRWLARFLGTREAEHSALLVRIKMKIGPPIMNAFAQVQSEAATVAAYR